MMVSILQIVLYTKPTAEHQYFYAHHVTPYTLNELFHSALPWKFDAYVPPTRRTTSFFSGWRYNVFILSHTLTQATHPRVSLYLTDTTQPFAQHHLFFTSTFTFSHPPNFVLLLLFEYIPLVTFLSTNRPQIH